MITGGDDLDTSSEELLGDLGGNAPTASRIFSIYDAKIDVMLAFNVSKVGDNGLSAGFADNIS